MRSESMILIASTGQLVVPLDDPSLHQTTLEGVLSRYPKGVCVLVFAVVEDST